MYRESEVMMSNIIHNLCKEKDGAVWGAHDELVYMYYAIFFDEVIYMQIKSM
jgi:hypothetical protein